MPKKKNKKKGQLVEKKLTRTCLCISVLLVMGILFGQITLSKISLEVQKLEKEVQNQNDTNQSLVMKINEMASLENIQNVSDELGLAYNNENIKTIDR